MARKAAGAPPAAAGDDRFGLFVATALALGIGLGFVLAVLLPLALVLQARWGLRWQALAQVHGHVQVVGFAGLFVVGMGYRLVPRFSGTPLAQRWTTMPAFVCLLTGVLLRTVAQPLSAGSLCAWAAAAAAALEFAGAAFFCLSVLATLRRPLRERRPWAPFLASAAVWLPAQAALNAVFFVGVARGGGPLNHVNGGRALLGDGQDQLVLVLQVYGFLLGFIFGVTTRAVPTFFAHRPSARVTFLVWIGLQAGICLSVLQLALTLAHGMGNRWLDVAGQLCLGATLIGAAALSGSWKAPSRLRPSARPAARLLTLAFLCCALAGALLIETALREAIDGRLPSGSDTDSMRHLLTVGVVTALIVGMGHLLIPALAVQRLSRAGRLRLPVLQGLLAGAVVLRAVPPLLTDLPSRVEDSLIGISGVLAWLAVLLFAATLWMAHRSQATAVAGSVRTAAGGSGSAAQA